MYVYLLINHHDCESNRSLITDIVYYFYYSLKELQLMNSIELAEIHQNSSKILGVLIYVFLTF